MSGLVILSVLVLPFLSWSEACGISVYWGQNGNEGSLRDACTSPSYKYISIAFLETFGSGKAPHLDLAGHCVGDSCKALASEITFCQNKGVKVLLSLGGPKGDYKLSNSVDATQVAENLRFTYLGGGLGGPLGDVTLDGIDFDLEAPSGTEYWYDLAVAISAYPKPDGSPVLLSAAVGCDYPDPYLDAAIKEGVFDSLWVKFYGNPKCDFASGVDGIKAAWRKWSAVVPAKTKLFMGLPASVAAARTGFIQPNTLNTQILPPIRNTPQYGGVMLWNRYFDGLSKYSSAISPEVCTTTTHNRTTFISTVV